MHVFVHMCLQCSVTCGKGVQRREAVCRRQTASGQLVTLDRSACSDLPLPPLIRSCRMSPCSSKILYARLSIFQPSLACHVSLNLNISV